jgi:hypothetical protein
MMKILVLNDTNVMTRLLHPTLHTDQPQNNSTTTKVMAQNNLETFPGFVYIP